MIYCGDRVYIRFFESSDAEALLNLTIRNRYRFEQVVPKRAESFYTIESHKEMLDLWSRAREQDQQYSFGVFVNETNQLIGEISFFDIARGPFQKTTLGYSLDEQFGGKGYMTEAVQLALQFAFREARFHRIEAGVMPSNLGSIRVLEKVGFVHEGLARGNVQINGNWEDHLTFAILEEDAQTLMHSR